MTYLTSYKINTSLPAFAHQSLLNALCPYSATEPTLPGHAPLIPLTPPPAPSPIPESARFPLLFSQHSWRESGLFSLVLRHNPRFETTDLPGHSAAQETGFTNHVAFQKLQLLDASPSPVTRQGGLIPAVVLEVNLKTPPSTPPTPLEPPLPHPLSSSVHSFSCPILPPTPILPASPPSISLSPALTLSSLMNQVFSVYRYNRSLGTRSWQLHPILELSRQESCP